ncbi:glycine betaine/proline transport system substrate-binding protein [Faunimonas pinastri]|uniref:Glycine betaine/proline transport system substrate-binding protein n=2 Tax=Faunimonas pinastri TaxID=1855383 RepID=A0A1H9C6J7_9HYPH|nr:glycine betaine/proline transport system substrate-binding protein [Faunimonas pinastri]
MVAGLTGFANAQDSKPVKIGWTAWADAEFVTKLAAKLITDKLNTKVELVQTDVAPLYQGVARGDLDAMMMAWLPQTHADYWKRVQDKVAVLGVLYTDAKLGWVVPDYIPEDQISSIADLKKDEIKSKLGGEVQGIDPGAGLTRLSHKAVEDYGLDYKLVESSEAAMMTTIDRDMRSKKWFVATSWSPHWMFGKYKLRYIADPKGSLGGVERVYAISRKGFQNDHPDVAQFLMRMNLPLKELESAMADAQDTSYEQAVDKYIASHQARVNYWLTGEIGEQG